MPRRVFVSRTRCREIGREREVRVLDLPRLASFDPTNKREELGVAMKNPLDSLWGTIISGLVLTLILYLIAKALIGS